MSAGTPAGVIAPKHVVITGFMAVGKTDVGKGLALRLGRGFIDMDRLCEEAAGASIAEIFGREGETGFRRVEKEVVASLAPNEPAVIATGGGAYVDPENRRRLRALGITVCLEASLETILERIARGGVRPLGGGEDPGPELRRLLDERASVYRDVDVVFSTDGRTVVESVERLLARITPLLAVGREEL